MAPLTAVDLFAGAGGATQGLRDAGFHVVGAIENDRDAAVTYRLNQPAVRLWASDIRAVAATKLRDELNLERGALTLLKACPPCQGFSSLAEGRASVDETRNDLVGDVGRFVRAFRPSAVLLENVTGLQRDARFPKLLTTFAAMGYGHRVYRIDAAELGVPQRRRRLIVLAVRSQRRDLPSSLLDLLPEDFDRTPVTVRDALDTLAAEHLQDDALDVFRKSQPVVLARIKAIPEGGTRFDLPAAHQLICHRKVDKTSRSAGASYGRIKLDQPAPTMTTRCTTPACGTFIHPTEHRGITLREAATFQTFPHDYQFHGRYGSVERQIGNAVPVRMAAALGHAVLTALRLSQLVP